MKKNLGFTLIEMLVTLALFVTIATAGYSAFLGFSGSNDLNNTTANALNLINTAKTDTLSNVDASTCQPYLTFLGYQVNVSDHSYDLKIACIDEDNSSIHYGKVETFNVPSTINLDLQMYYGNHQLTSANSMLFLASEGATLDTTYVNTITGANSGVSKITVTDKGSISEQ